MGLKLGFKSGLRWGLKSGFEVGSEEGFTLGVEVDFVLLLVSTAYFCVDSIPHAKSNCSNESRSTY